MPLWGVDLQLPSFISISPGTVCLWRPNEVARCSQDLGCQSRTPSQNLITFVWLFSTVCFQVCPQMAANLEHLYKHLSGWQKNWPIFIPLKHQRLSEGEIQPSPNSLKNWEINSGNHYQFHRFWQQYGTDSGPARSSAEVPWIVIAHIMRFMIFKFGGVV